MVPLALAKAYSDRGWAPVPVEYRSKRCRLKGWNHEIITPGELKKHFQEDQQNIGIVLGVFSNGLIDIDLDHPLAVAMAPKYLPPTGAVFGRPGKKGSHWLYKSCGIGLIQKEIPEVKGPGAMVMEIRGTGGYTVFPGSTHESGELITWETDGDPAEIDSADLIAAVERLYEAVLDIILIRIELNFDSYGTKTDPLTVEERARLYLDKIPPAIAFSGGHIQTFKAARAMVWGFDLSPAKAADILLAHYNPRCDPPWKPHEIEHKVKDADTKQFDKPRGWLKDAENPDYEEGDFSRAGQEEKAADIPPAEPGRFLSLPDLWIRFPILRRPIVHGLLRQGEVMNVVSATKVGKSWLVNDLALAVASGGMWLDTFKCESGRVLIIDNELHPETSADRTQKVAKAMGLCDPAIISRVFVDNVRGKLMDLLALDKYLANVQPGQFDLIILDAFYRFLINGTDENDNGAIAAAYNRLDKMGERMATAFGLIHHSSKGSQSGKGVTDVGSGAGSQSRAADSHVVLRHHREEGAVVLDAAVRSWAPIKPVCLRFEFPRWHPDTTLDPTDLRPERQRRAAAPASGGPAIEGKEVIAWTAERFADECVGNAPERVKVCEARAVTGGCSKRGSEELRAMAVSQGLVFFTGGNGKPAFLSKVQLSPEFPE